MTAAEIKEQYITAPEIAQELGVKNTTVHNWLRYHRYMPWENVLGRPAVPRSAYEKFKSDRPDLKEPAALATA